MVFPGEIAVLLGGVAAGRGSVNFAAVLIAACVGAVAGDQVGYWIGHRYGQQLLRRLPDRLLDEERLENARVFVRRTGAKGVVLGRWTAALRALVPGMAGMSHMPYPRFATANVVGGVLWASLVASVGYIAGDSWHRVQSALGSASTVLLGLILVAAVAWHVSRRVRERRRARAAVEPARTAAVDIAAADSDPASINVAAANPETALASAASASAASMHAASSRADPGGVAPRLTRGRSLGPTRPRPPSQPEVSWSSAFPGASLPLLFVVLACVGVAACAVYSIRATADAGTGIGARQVGATARCPVAGSAGSAGSAGPTGTGPADGRGAVQPTDRPRPVRPRPASPHPAAAGRGGGTGRAARTRPVHRRRRRYASERGTTLALGVEPGAFRVYTPANTASVAPLWRIDRSR